MASASFTDDLTCSICLNIFTDPVTLPCGHSFCRPCLKGFLDAHHQCPQCRASLASGEEMKRLSTNFILLSLAEKAKQGDGIDTEHLTGKPESSSSVKEGHDRAEQGFRRRTDLPGDAYSC
ncbi:tripartite motif-containing protein 59 isoform X2 [Phyllopteryx taeniolatus]|uniref:tripartite motif-containing protein 59 isoform X2 n=1 Tax=Phyllopteryx taeniolatus TaxID=161469 RepID=UPI002AD38C1D|nr:tripartite motif-containing protein 59 isoform X2 [Phyllopteryx taeniolatus]